MNDRSIDPQSRAMIRYAMETNDPWLVRLVRQAGTEGTIDLSEIPLGSEADSTEDKVKVLTDKICRGGEEPTAALLVLMATLENATHPKVLMHMAKQLTFTYCVEVNAYGVVDAQIEMLEGELFEDLS